MTKQWVWLKSSLLFVCSISLGRTADLSAGTHKPVAELPFIYKSNRHKSYQAWYLCCFSLHTAAADVQATLKPTSTTAASFHGAPDLISVISVVADACSVLFELALHVCTEKDREVPERANVNKCKLLKMEIKIFWRSPDWNTFFIHWLTITSLTQKMVIPKANLQYNTVTLRWE